MPRRSSIFAIGVSISALSDRGLLPIAASGNLQKEPVSISALSDRGLLPIVFYITSEDLPFQYPLFRIVDCFLALMTTENWTYLRFNIRSFGSWIASSKVPWLC